jgi:hypothetical protein
MTIALVGVLAMATLFTFGSSGRVQTASANPIMELQCATPDTPNVKGQTVDLNTIVQCHSHDTDSSINAFHFWITDPNGNVVVNSGVAPYTPGKDIKYIFPANVAGQWSVEIVYYTKDGHQIHEKCDMNVNFFVLPESSIGTVALMGSSIAVLGAFVGLRRFKAASHPTTTF